MSNLFAKLKTGANVSARPIGGGDVVDVFWDRAVGWLTVNKHTLPGSPDEVFAWSQGYEEVAAPEKAKRAPKRATSKGRRS